MIIYSFLALKVIVIIGIIGSTISISLEILTVRIISVLIILEILLGYKFLLLKLRLIVVFLSLLVGYSFFLLVLFKIEISLPHGFLQGLRVIILNSVLNVIW